MHQRIAMQTFERGARQQRALRARAEQRGGFHQQKRAQPFSAAEHRMAHGGEQARRPRDFARCRLSAQQAIEQGVGLGGNGGQA